MSNSSSIENENTKEKNNSDNYREDNSQVIVEIPNTSNL